MKRFNIFAMICILAVSTMYAQEDTVHKAWKFDGVIGLNGGATNLIFWSGGGNDNANANALTFAKLRLQYQKNAIAWETNFDTDFGLIWVDQSDDQLKKSSDAIKFNTKLGWELKENL